METLIGAVCPVCHVPSEHWNEHVIYVLESGKQHDICSPTCFVEFVERACSRKRLAKMFHEEPKTEEPEPKSFTAPWS